MVEISEVTAVLDSVAHGLPENAQDVLVNKLVRIFGLYLGRQQLEKRKASNARSRELLELIRTSCARLVLHLNALENDYLVAIDCKRASLASEAHVKRFALDEQDPSAGEAHVRHFNLLQLVPALGTLGEAASAVADEHAALPTGGQRKDDLDKTVAAITVALRGRLPIEPLDHGSGKAQRKTVQGPGGELLKELFHAFDPYVDEPALYGALKRLEAIRTERLQAPD